MLRTGRNRPLREVAPAINTPSCLRVTVSNVKVVSSTQITATFTVAPTAFATVVIVSTSGNVNAQLGFRISLPIPTLTSISPNNGALGSAVIVTLAGTNFVSGATLYIANPGVAINNVTVASAAQISATFAISAAAASGAFGVEVARTTASGHIFPNLSRGKWHLLL